MATDSIHEQDPHEEPVQKKTKSRRPGNTAFRQQRLKAWQPILTPKTVLPIFFAVGVIFAPIGGLLLWASASVQELSIDYTHCTQQASSDFSTVPDGSYSMSFKSSNKTSKPLWKTNNTQVTPPYSVSLNANVCTLQFSLPNDIGPPVYLYYRLTNFYQNHRRYVKSLDTDQLKGDALTNNTIGSSACDPLRVDSATGKAYYPCGLIANSLFNDTIKSPVLVNAAAGQTGEEFVMTNQSIAWSSDKSLYKQTKYTNDQVSPPPNWALRYPNGYTTENPIPDLSTYEELQVWMRTAGLPTFSKLALRNDNDTMKAGTYNIDIYDFFPVTVYGGTKTMFISTRTVMGGKNSFLGIAYIVVGGLCIVLGVFFTLAHLIRPRKLGDHTYLSWNNPEPQPTATATGSTIRPGTQG